MSAIDLLPYQKKWLEDKSRYKIGLWSRQVGKTFSSTLEIIDDIFEAMAENRRTTWIVLSAGERQAKEALEGCKRHCSVYQLAFESFEGESHEDGATFKIQEIRFSNGSRVISLPANPSTVRGYSGNLYFDEACFWKDSDAIWQAAAPIATRGGFKIRMTSTPAGKSGIFYRLWTDLDNAWSKHRVTIYEAVEQGLNLDIDELQKAINDPDVWQVEYCLDWADGNTNWLSYDLIATCEHEAAGFVDAYQGGLCYIGNDIARRNDLWVAWVFEAVGDVLWTREIVTLRRVSFAEQDAVMDDLFKRYRVRRLCMDQTGMGEKPVEDAIRRYGSSRVEGVLFTGANKQTLATIGKQSFEDRRLRIPAGDQELRQDLHKLKKVVSPIGNIRFDADSDEQGHADRAWSCFLGLYAASGTHVPIDFEPVEVERDLVGVGDGGLDGFSNFSDWSGF